MKRRHSRIQALALLLAVSLVIAGCTATRTDETPQEWSAPGASIDPGAAVAALPVEQLASAVASRAADDLAPPTNRWYSGLVFGDTSQRVFPFPLALNVQPESFAVSLPRVTASATTIEAGDAAGVTVAIPADAFTVVRADPVSVTARYTRDAAVVGDLTTAEGWPVVAFTAAQDVTLTAGAELRSAAPDTWSTTVDGQEYGVHAPGATVEGGSLRLRAGAASQWFAVPADSDIDAWAETLGDPVTSVTTSYAASDDTVSTRLVFDGTDSTVLVPFPGREPEQRCDLGSFETAFGTASACAATSMEWSVPRLAASDSYDFESLDEDSRAMLAAQIKTDLAETEPFPSDTYFGGKALARLAALLSLADSLGEDALAEDVADRLEAEFEPWTDPAGCVERDARCFVYDDALHLVVGRTPSFGSEEGNDHHFHYGYFLAAAAALADARPELVDTLAPVMDALAADITAGAADPALPALRVFDPYRGHSWASGPSPFASGNNQESSSEAVAAWNGLALWARARGDAGLEATAAWMLSAEAAAARSLWLEPDLGDFASGYEHGIVSLTWGGKRDYATWFSPEPSAILGIQILPVGPIALDYLAGSPQRVAANVDEAGGDAAFDGPLGEYVLAYSALAGPGERAHAEEIARGLDAEGLDDGTSLSAMLAWLAAVRLAQEP
jgi:endo-1,3(4)-beta-glucanase